MGDWEVISRAGRCKKCGARHGVYGPSSEWLAKSDEGIFMPVVCQNCGHEYLLYFEFVEQWEKR